MFGLLNRIVQIVSIGRNRVIDLLVFNLFHSLLFFIPNFDLSLSAMLLEIELEM
jgi:hypothetical protein